MTRFEDSPDLFGGGIGCSTHGEFTCLICGTACNKGNDETENYIGDPVGYTDFAGGCICNDCFEIVEFEILKRMSDILPWYKRFLDNTKKRTAYMENLVKEVTT